MPIASGAPLSSFGHYATQVLTLHNAGRERNRQMRVLHQANTLLAISAKATGPAVDFLPEVRALRHQLDSEGIQLRGYAWADEATSPSRLPHATQALLQLLGSSRNITRLRIWCSLAAAARHVAQQDLGRPVAAEAFFAAERVCAAGRITVSLSLPGLPAGALVVPILDLSRYAWPLLDPKDGRDVLQAVFELGALWDVLPPSPDNGPMLAAMGEVLHLVVLDGRVPAALRLPLMDAVTALGERAARLQGNATKPAVAAGPPVQASRVPAFPAALPAPEAPKPQPPSSPSASSLTSTLRSRSQSSTASEEVWADATDELAVELVGEVAAAAVPASPTSGTERTPWQQLLAACAEQTVSAAAVEKLLTTAEAVAPAQRIAAFAGADLRDVMQVVESWRALRQQQSEQAGAWPATKPQPADLLRLLLAYVTHTADAHQQQQRAGAVINALANDELGFGWTLAQALPRKAAESLGDAVGWRLLLQPPPSVRPEVTRLAEFWLRRAVAAPANFLPLLASDAGNLEGWLHTPALLAPLGRLVAAALAAAKLPTPQAATAFADAWIVAASGEDGGPALVAALQGVAADSPLMLRVTQLLTAEPARCAAQPSFVALLGQKLASKRAIDAAARATQEAGLQILLTRDPDRWEDLAWEQGHAWSLLAGSDPDGQHTALCAAIRSLQRCGAKCGKTPAGVFAHAAKYCSAQLQLHVAGVLVPENMVDVDLAHAVAALVTRLGRAQREHSKAFGSNAADALQAVLATCVLNTGSAQGSRRVAAETIWLALERAQFLVPLCLLSGAHQRAATVVHLAQQHRESASKVLMPLACNLADLNVGSHALMAFFHALNVELQEILQAQRKLDTQPVPTSKAAYHAFVTQQSFDKLLLRRARLAMRNFVGACATSVAYAWARSTNAPFFAQDGGLGVAQAPENDAGPPAPADLVQLADVLSVRQGVGFWQQQELPLQRLRQHLANCANDRKELEAWAVHTLATSDQPGPLTQLYLPTLVALLRTVPAGPRRHAEVLRLAKALRLPSFSSSEPIADADDLASRTFAARLSLALQPTVMQGAPACEVEALQHVAMLRALRHPDEREWRSIHAMVTGLRLTAPAGSAAVLAGCRSAFRQALQEQCNFADLEDVARKVQRFLTIGCGVAVLLPQQAGVALDWVDCLVDEVVASGQADRVVPSLHELLVQNLDWTRTQPFDQATTKLAEDMLARYVRRTQAYKLQLTYPANSQENRYAWSCCVAELGVVAATIAAMDTWMEEPHDGSLAQGYLTLRDLWQRGGYRAEQSPSADYDSFDYACGDALFRQALLTTLVEHGQGAAKLNTQLLKRMLAVQALQPNEKALFAQVAKQAGAIDAAAPR